MPRILIVEDEKDYREQIQTILSWEGYEVRTAANGREAIDIGARFRPDVLVTDWMLRDQIHGLHVIGALRLVHGGFRAILITAFASEDLKAEAGTRRVFEFIEKPFDLEHFQEVVRAAVAQRGAELQTPSVAVAEIDGKGRILYANPMAAEMFAEASAGRGARTLSDLFAPDQIPDLGAAAGRWLTASPTLSNRQTWELRSQRPENADTWLVVLRRQAGSLRTSQQLIDMLLAVREGKLARWPFDKRVLVVDDDQLQRQLAVAQLEGAGAGCYAAESFDEATRLLEEDEGIGFVVLDYDMPGVDAGRLATRLKALRPSLRIVGNSGMDRQAEFARFGVTQFLFKPWSINHLIEACGG
jgi:DNA-binding NtrC family response regulator